jgi:hypothetical protein
LPSGISFENLGVEHGASGKLPEESVKEFGDFLVRKQFKNVQCSFPECPYQDAFDAKVKTINCIRLASPELYFRKYALPSVLEIDFHCRLFWSLPPNVREFLD